MTDSWLNKVNWAADGLVPAIAQDAVSGEVRFQYCQSLPHLDTARRHEVFCFAD